MSDFSCEGDFSSTDGGGPSKKNSARGEMAINFSSAEERVRIGKDEMDFLMQVKVAWRSISQTKTIKPIVWRWISPR